MSNAPEDGEGLLSSIFSSIQDGISILDADMRIVRVNPAMESWYCHAMPLTGKKCYKAYHGRDRPCEVCPSRETLRTGEVAYEVVPKTGVGGEVVGWLDLYSFPLLETTSGEMRGVIEYVRDITERRRAEEALRASEEHFRLMVQNAQDLLFRYSLKPQRGFEFVSPSVVDFTGYTPEEHYADPELGSKMIHPDDLPRLKETMRSPELVRQPVTLRWIAKNGDVVWTEQHNVPIYDDAGELVAIEGIARNVTQREKVEQLKSDFVSMISHELRTPLTNIVGYSSVLLRDDVREKPELQVKAAQKIHERATQMCRLVDEILEVSRIQSGDLCLSFQPADLEKLVTHCVESAPTAAEHTISVDVAKGLPAVSCDAHRLCWAIGNLVSNAVKFSPRGGAVEVSVRARDDEVLIAVKDEGVGIDRKEVPGLFERFKQADMSSTRAFGGWGLGLFVADQVVRGHGGRIDVESEPGKGSTFTIEIPISRD